MSTTEIGALIVSLRSESATFRAEMDKARTSIKGAGAQAEASTRQIAKLAADGFGAVLPITNKVENQIERFIEKTIAAKGAVGLLAKSTVLLGAGFGAFKIGSLISEFAELGTTAAKYAENVKKATEEQTKFSAAMSQQRNVVRGFQKELASLTNDQEALLRLTDDERRERIQQLPVGQRAAAEIAAAKAAAAARSKSLNDQRAERDKADQELLDQILKARETQVKAWETETQALVDQLKIRLTARQNFEAQLGRGGLPGTGLSQGLAATRDFGAQIGKEALDIAGLERLGRLSSRDATAERQNIRERALAQAEDLRREFAAFPPVLDAIDRAVASVEFGNFGLEMERARVEADRLLATDQQLTQSLGAIASKLVETIPATESAAQATATLTRAYLELANGIYAAVNAKLAFDQVTVE